MSITLRYRFPIKLREAREAKGWSLEYLGELSGLTGDHIGHFEAGRRLPSLENFDKLCVALNIDPEKLGVGCLNKGGE